MRADDKQVDIFFALLFKYLINCFAISDIR